MRKTRAFLEGFFSINGYASMMDDPRVAEYLRATPEELMASHWREVGQHLYAAIGQFEDAQKQDTKIAEAADSAQ